MIRARSEKAGIGFSAKLNSKNGNDIEEILATLESDDLVKYGLIPEFVGRLPVVTTLHELDEAALIDILTKPKNALVKQFHALFKMENADLQFHDAALKLIAKKAIARKIGARGLRATIENILLDTMYELPSMEDVQTVVVDESVVNGIQSPILVYADEEKKAV